MRRLPFVTAVVLALACLTYIAITGIRERSPLVPAPRAVPSHTDDPELRSASAVVVLLGDSIVAQAGNHLGAVSLPPETLNLGVPGDGVQHLQWRLNSGLLKDLHPQVIVLSIGTNNATAGSWWNRPSIADTVSAIDGVLATIRQQQPTARVLLLHLLPRGHPDDDARVQAINREIPRLAAKHDATSLDLSSHFRPVSRDLMPDGIHLSDRGNEIWCREVGKAVAAVLSRE